MSRQLTEEVLVDEGTIDLVKKYNQFNIPLDAIGLAHNFMENGNNFKNNKP